MASASRRLRAFLPHTYRIWPKIKGSEQIWAINQISDALKASYYCSAVSGSVLHLNINRGRARPQTWSFPDLSSCDILMLASCTEPVQYWRCDVLASLVMGLRRDSNAFDCSVAQLFLLHHVMCFFPSHGCRICYVSNWTVTCSKHCFFSLHIFGNLYRKSLFIFTDSALS